MTFLLFGLTIVDTELLYETVFGEQENRVIGTRKNKNSRNKFHTQFPLNDLSNFFIFKYSIILSNIV